MNKIDYYIADIESEHLQELLSEIHYLITSTLPEVQETIKWKVPYYMYYGHLCYLNPKKKQGYVDIGFMKGTQLSNTQGILVGDGKLVRHIKIHTIEDIHREAVIEVLLEAALLNETVNKK